MARIDRETRGVLLRRIGLFGQVEDGDLDVIAEALAESVFQPDQVILREGDPGSSFLIIATGKVAIVKGQDDRQEILAVLEPGQFFGEMALLDGSPRAAGAVARTEVCLLSLDRADFHRAIQRQPDILWRITPILTARLRDTSDRLHATLNELEGRSRELQGAYLELERKNAAIAGKLERGRKTAFAALAALAVAGGAVAAVLVGGGATSISAAAPEQRADSAAAGDIARATVQPVQSQVTLSGKLDPSRVINVPSPIASTVADMAFTYGAMVTKGDLLLRLDTTRLDADIRDARAKVIRAEQDLAERVNWTGGSDMANARRMLTRAEAQVADAQRTLREAEGLFQKGIVPEREVISARQHFDSARLDVASAQDALEAMRRKGNGDHVSIARMEAENARVHLQQLLARKEASDIRAPVTGVVLRPALKDSQSGPADLEIGRPVGDGQVLLAVGETASLAVKTAVDEFDVAKLAVGQSALVTTDALDKTVTGRVVAVSSQPNPGEGTGPQVARYPVTVLVDAQGGDGLDGLRLGMSATINVVIRATAEALLVPPAAVSVGPDKVASVTRLGAGDAPERVTVRLGGRYAAGVEVVSGLSAGDRLLVTR